MKISDIKQDCRFFKGDIPCKPSKIHGVLCTDCKYYDKIKEKILIIKLAAAGDVLRTTPLLYPLNKKYPESYIIWLTNFSELVPQKKFDLNFKNKTIGVDTIFEYNLNNVLFLKEIEFDVIINLDKDNEAIALTKSIKSKEKYGFTLEDRFCYPVNKFADGKYLTGTFDFISKQNKKSYLEEIFEICGFKFNKEKYILDKDTILKEEWNIDKTKIIVGLNTGCGARWISREWKEEYWIKLVNLLNEENFEVILLGGPQEHSKNLRIKERTKAKYFGNFELKKFIDLVDNCNIIVTQVTMALHIAIALEKYVVLMNNIFNPNEFELYDNGVIIMPDRECRCYYSPVCTNQEYNCMDFLPAEKIFNAILDYRKSKNK